MPYKAVAKYKDRKGIKYFIAYYKENSSRFISEKTVAFINKRSSSLFFVSLTVRCRCVFDVQCEKWINNTPWLFDIFPLLKTSGRTTCLSLFSLSAVSPWASVIGQHTRPELVVSKTLKSNLPLQAQRDAHQRARSVFFIFFFIYKIKFIYLFVFVC